MYDVKIVLSAPHPMFKDIVTKLIRFKPDYVFCSSRNLKERIQLLNWPSHLLANGVDKKKFIPLSNYEKKKLRKKYSIPENDFIILHVGHIKSERNLKIFSKLSKEGQVVIVASESIKVDPKLLLYLQYTNSKIFRGYYPNIEEFYQLADCYLFPVKPGNSILFPLSIVEAMACNLPVITTEFDGIITFCKEGEGLIFVKKEEDFLNAIKKIKTKDTTVNTRNKIECYSWENITKEMVECYSKLLKCSEKNI